MAYFKIPYKKIDHIMGTAKLVPSDTYRGRRQLRLTFVRTYISAICPSLKGVNDIISEPTSGDADYLNVSVWDESQAQKIWDALVNYDGSIIHFPIDKSNIDSVVKWLLAHNKPEDYEIASLMGGSDMSLVFENRDHAMKFKLGYMKEDE